MSLIYPEMEMSRNFLLATYATRLTWRNQNEMFRVFQSIEKQLPVFTTWGAIHKILHEQFDNLYY